MCHNKDDNIIQHIIWHGVTKNDLLLYLTRRKNNNSVLSIQTTLFFCAYNFHNTKKNSKKVV